MRIVFFGSGTFGLASLRALLEAGRPPVLVVTQPPRRRRRRGHAEPTPVHAAAAEAGVEVITPAQVNQEETLARLRAADAALFVTAEYGQILSQALLDIAPTINVHASLLPRWRGAAPVVGALLAGDTETGITIQRTVLKLDEGPILAVRRLAIEPEEDAGSLAARLAPLGGELLLEVVEALAAGTPPPDRPQDEAQATYCKRLKADDTRIDWTRSAAEIARMVRAFSPKPGARSVLEREPPLPLELKAAVAVPGAGEPGVVAAVGRESFDVATGDGCLRVSALVPAARKPMDARAFLNGYRLSVGERFC